MRPCVVCREVRGGVDGEGAVSPRGFDEAVSSQVGELGDGGGGGGEEGAHREVPNRGGGGDRARKLDQGGGCVCDDSSPGSWSPSEGAASTAGRAGVGEKADDLETFNPKGFVSRLLGMGDLEALLEKAKEVIDEENAGDIKDRLTSGEFNLNDLYEQMKAMKKMGPLNKIMEMIPGFSGLKMPKEALQVQEGKLEKWKYIIDSCTKKERNDPELIDSKRAERIAKGSGTTISEVRELIKQYRMAKKMMKMMKGKDPEKLLKKGRMPFKLK